MKRNHKKSTRNLRNNSRKQVKNTRSLSYDPLENRQMLTVGIGFNTIGATFTTNTPAPNPEGDVGPNHFVEIGERTFTVYDRNSAIVESTSLNQFFLDSGADLVGEELSSPRIVFDRGSQRWFAVASGDGNGDFEPNWIHVAFSDTSDPTGQWQQVQFVPDITGVRLHDNVTLGVDADGVYLATQNFIDGDLEDVSIYSLPKADLFLPNPTLANLSRFESLDILEYGVSIQFANNFEASDGTVFAFSTPIEIGVGGPELAPANINSFQIMGADTDSATLTTPVQIEVGAFDAPRPINQLSADGMSTVALTAPAGLTSALFEVDGSVFGAQTVHIQFEEGIADYRTNAINWFQFNVQAGQDPVLAESPLRGAVSHVFVDNTFIGDFLPDPPEFDTDPTLPTPEIGDVSYFNPAFAMSENGLVALTFNGTSSFDLFGTGATPPATPTRISTFASVGLMVNGAQTGTDPMGNPIFPRNAIQLEDPVIIRQSFAADPFTQPGVENPWGEYSSLRTDPENGNGFFSVIPVQDELSDEWLVVLTEILPIELRPVVEATADDNQIIVNLDPADSDFVQITIDGVITDRFERALISQIVILGHSGADEFIIDHTFGDPTPVEGFVLVGATGSDSVESRAVENQELFVDAFTPLNIFYPGYLLPFIGTTDPTGLIDDIAAQDGTFTLVTDAGSEVPAEDQISNIFIDFETVISGAGDDTFTFITGPLAGNAEGLDGDDRFIFVGDVRVDGSVNGGAGFNTLDLQQRTADTEIVLFSKGLNAGFNGRTVDGPIGQFEAVLDQFRDISLIRGSTSNATDSIQALNQFESTYTLVIPDISPDDAVNPDVADSFIASTYEADGTRMYFTHFEELIGSVLDDVFNVQSNDILELPVVRLDGRAGDDTFNFSSDAPTNFGVLSEIGGLFEVNGGIGDNSLVVSDAGRMGPDDFLLLSARVTGPVEVIYFAEDEQTMEQGTFDVTIFGSDSAADTFILQSFLSTNTLNVHGLAGDDIFVIQDLSQAAVNLFGGEGDDEYVIEQVNGIDDRNVIITDSVGGTEVDVAIIAGTLLDEVFIVDFDSFVSDQFEFIGVEEFGFDGRGGDDEFYVREISSEFPIILRGSDGNDVFYISSDAPTNLGDLSTINNNLTIDGGTGINRIIISNESGSALDVDITSTEITGLFNGVLHYSSTGGVFGLVDENGDLDTENFGGIDITGSNGGDDTFRISTFFAQHSLVIDARLGEDEFLIGQGVDDLVEGVVIVDGGSDGDTYSVYLANINSQNVIIDDSGFSGVDTLNAKGTEDSDNIDLTEFNISTDDVMVGINDFIEAIVIEGLGGNDLLTMSNAPAEFVTLSGNDGDDEIRVTGTVGVSELTVFGGDGFDDLEIQEASLLTSVSVFGGNGNDVLEVGGDVLGDVTLDGQADQDLYTVNLVGSGSRTVQIVENLMDSLSILGAANAEEFSIDNSSVISASESVLFGDGLTLLLVSGRGGADVFNVTETQSAVLSLMGNAGNDVFNISSDAPAQSGDTLGIQSFAGVDGGDGLNRLNITNAAGEPSVVTITDTEIVGLTNGFTLQYFGQFARTDGEIGGIHIIGSDNGDDSFDVQSLAAGNTLRIDGLSGNDDFHIGNSIDGDALFDGGDGSDTYFFEFGATTPREIVIDDTGASGTDTLNLIGSDTDDNIVIAPDVISDGISTLTFNIPLTVIEIFALGGNDTFTINGASTTAVTLHGNAGNDTFIVNNTDGLDDINLFGGIDDDVFEFNGSVNPTRIDALGSLGNDTYTVNTGAFGSLFLDGEAGSDIYTVFFAGEGDRRINTRDSGTNGNDVTQAFGTGTDDRIAVRTTRFLYDDEVVIFDENTERVSLDSGDGDDRLVVFGSRSALTEVFAGAGADNFVMNSGSRADVINLRGESGDDTYLIRKTTVDTTTNLFGGNGNDRFNVGSTVNQDVGNLGLIRGVLNVFGGSNDAGEEDKLLVNDHGVDAAYSYAITPTSINAIPGPAGLEREIFAGINYNSSTEFLRLDGTPLANLFEVTASQTTRYFIDGNNPNGSVGDILEVVFQPNDGRQMFITNAAQGAGFVTFTNGNEIVQFDDIEMPTLADGSSNFTLPPGFDPFDFGFDEFFSTADLDVWTEIDDALL